MIRLDRVVKSFGSRLVLRGVDLEVAGGEFVVLMGANGAGKTTLMRLIAALGTCTAGKIYVGDADIASHSAAVRRYIGFVSHRTLLYEDLTAIENLRFFGRLYDVPDVGDRSELLLRQVGLWGRQHDPVRTYSRGMQQRLAIARALLHDPPILLLDEPDTGLDQRATSLLAELLQAVGVTHRTVLMTTHNIERGFELADRLAILAGGKIVYQGVRTEIEARQFRRLYEQHVAA